MDRVRIGTLGAARIAPAALIRPAREITGAEVTAVAARDPAKARRFATKHDISRVHDTYAVLVDDPDVDAVYVPLPNGLHAEWTLRALAAGKHVLCEKPFTANVSEARDVADAAKGSDRVVMEAFHYRYHPVAERMREIARSGELGEVRHVETWMCIPLPLPRDIRYRYDLAGGAVMDVGCYALHMNRLLAGERPEVVSATAKTTRDPRVDRWARAELRYPSGTSGTMTCALWSTTLFRIGVRVTGELGVLKVFNPTGPHFGYRMTVTTPEGRRRVRVDGARTATYTYQLEAFTAAVVRGQPILTPPTDSVTTMETIDAVYAAAGLPPRGTGR